MAGRAEYDRELLGRVQPWLDVSVATFLTLGTAAAQNLLAINNPAASGRIVTLRRLTGSMQTVAVGNRPVFLLKSPAVATGGTILAQTEDRTGQAATTLVGLGNCAADLGAGTALVIGAGSVRVVRKTTAANVAGFADFEFDGIDQSLEPGESFMITVDVAVTDNWQMTAYLTEHLGLG